MQALKAIEVPLDVPEEALTQAKGSSDGHPVVGQSSWVRIWDGKRLRSPIAEVESPVEGSKHQRLVIEDDDKESLEGLTADAKGSPELKGSVGDGNNELGSLQEVGTLSAVWVLLKGLMTEVEMVAGV